MDINRCLDLASKHERPSHKSFSYFNRLASTCDTSEHYLRSETGPLHLFVKEDFVAERERHPGSPELSLKPSESKTNLYTCFIIDCVRVCVCAIMDYGSQPVVRKNEFLPRSQGIPRNLLALLWISPGRWFRTSQKNTSSLFSPSSGSLGTETVGLSGIVRMVPVWVSCDRRSVFVSRALYVDVHTNG